MLSVVFEKVEDFFGEGFERAIALFDDSEQCDKWMNQQDEIFILYAGEIPDTAVNRIAYHDLPLNPFESLTHRNATAIRA